MQILKLAIGAASLVGAMSAGAQILDPYVSAAAGMYPRSAYYETGGGSVGSEFTVTQDVNNVSLAGIWDYNAAMLGNDTAGLAQSHEVQVWADNNGTWNLLATATVAAGTVDPLYDGFRWASLNNAITLVPGTTYLVDAYYSGVNDDLIAGGSHVTDAPYNWLSDADSNPAGSPPQSGIANPNSVTFSSDDTQGLFGPDLAPTVPEPGTLSLLLAPVGAYALRTLRQHRRR